MSKPSPSRKRARRARTPRVVTGMESVQLSKSEFERRFLERFYDPSFDPVASEIARIADVAWTNYIDYHKSPLTRRAGRGYADPDFELPLEWLATRARIREAERRQKKRTGPSRFLIINGSARSDQTCPGEMSKTYRNPIHPYHPKEPAI